MSIGSWMQNPNDYYLKVVNEGQKDEQLVSVKKCKGIRDVFSSVESFCNFCDVLIHKNSYKFENVMKHISDHKENYNSIKFICLVNNIISENYNPKHEKKINQLPIPISNYDSQNKILQELKEKKQIWRFPEELAGDIGRWPPDKRNEAPQDVKKLFLILEALENKNTPMEERKALFEDFVNSFSLTEENVGDVLKKAMEDTERPAWQWRKTGCEAILQLMKEFKKPTDLL